MKGLLNSLSILPPGWVMPGAYIDLDLANDRTYNGSVSGTAIANSGTIGSMIMGGSSGIALYAPIKGDPLRKLKAFVAFQVRVTRGYGLWAANLKRNTCLQSRDLTNASWTKTNCSAAKNQVGADGVTNGASRLTASGANATCLQAVDMGARDVAIAVAGTGYATNEVVTLTGGTFTTAAKVKVTAQSGGVPSTISINPGVTSTNRGAYQVNPTNPVLQGSTTGSGIGLTVNLTFNGIFSCWMRRSTVTGAIYMTVDNGAAYVDITSQIPTSGWGLVSIPNRTDLTTATIGFKIENSGDIIDVDFCEFEDTSYVSQSPIPNTTTYTALTSDEPAISDPGGSRPHASEIIRGIMCNGMPWGMFVSASGASAIGATILSDGGLTIDMGTGGGAASFASASQSSGNTANTGTNGIGNINKLVGRAEFSTRGAAACLNGGTVAQGSATAVSTQAAAFTHIGLGNNGAGATPLDGPINRIAFFKRPPADGEMISLSRSDSQYGNAGLGY